LGLKSRPKPKHRPKSKLSSGSGSAMSKTPGGKKSWPNSFRQAENGNCGHTYQPTDGRSSIIVLGSLVKRMLLPSFRLLFSIIHNGSEAPLGTVRSPGNPALSE